MFRYDASLNPRADENVMNARQNPALPKGVKREIRSWTSVARQFPQAAISRPHFRGAASTSQFLTSP